MEDLIRAINQLRYMADDINEAEEAYQQLQMLCQEHGLEIIVEDRDVEGAPVYAVREKK